MSNGPPQNRRTMRGLSEQHGVSQRTRAVDCRLHHSFTSFTHAGFARQQMAPEERQEPHS